MKQTADLVNSGLSSASEDCTTLTKGGVYSGRYHSTFLSGEKPANACFLCLLVCFFAVSQCTSYIIVIPRVHGFYMVYNYNPEGPGLCLSAARTLLRAWGII